MSNGGSSADPLRPAPRRARVKRGSQPKRGGLHSLGDSIETYLAASGLGKQLANGPVYEAWSRVAGERMGRHARPVRFEGGTLQVEVDSAAHLHELEAFIGEDLRLRANHALARSAGHLVIHRVQFKLKS